MARIIKVVPHDDHTLTLELSNNHRIIYDMRARLQTTRFCKLADIGKFLAVRLENENTLVWDNLCQLTIDEIISMVER
jgi:hypothetical protein